MINLLHSLIMVVQSLAVLFSVLSTATVHSHIVHIGALVKHDSPEAKVIDYVLEYVNSRTDLLPSHFLTVRYPITDDVQLHDNLVYEALHLLEEGVSVILAPDGADDITVLHRLLAPKGITQIVPTETSDTVSNKEFLVQLNTANRVTNRAICDTLQQFNWTRAAVLTAEGEWSSYLQNLWNECMFDGITIQTLEEHAIPDLPQFVQSTEQLKRIKSVDTRVIVLFTHMMYVPTIMRDAFDVGLLEAGYAWLIVDIHEQFNAVYKQGVPPGFPPYLRGLLVLRPLMSDGNLLSEFRRQWADRDIPILPKSSLYSDAVLLFAYALHELLVDNHPFYQEKIALLGEGVWEVGETLYRYMMKQRFNGLSREIHFGTDRSIVDKRFGLFNVVDGKTIDDYFDYGGIGLSKIGYWNPDRRLQMHKNAQIIWPSNLNTTPTDRPQSLKNRKFRIVTIESPPFVMVNKDKVGNERYRGFLPDMLKKLQERLEFQYELYEVEDNSWGAKDPTTGMWGGVVGDVYRGKAHFTLADLAVTSVRDEAVRFSQSYFRSGMALSMAVDNPQKEMFYWMSPLGWKVWAAVILFGVICAISMSSYSKLSPFGYYGRYYDRGGDSPASEEDKNRFSFKNCVWFIVSSFFQQGPDNGSPTCISGRIVAAAWWVFCLLVIIMYTANLTANLTVSNMKKPIESLQSLLEQSEYQFGTVKGTSYENIFSGSKLSLYNKIAEKMMWLNSSSQAYNKTVQEKFVFIWDSPQIDYNMAAYDCKFTRVGAEFGYSQYALAFPKHNESMNHVVQLIDREILAMVEVSELKKMYDEWLSSETTECERPLSNSKETLDTKDLKGVFVVMLSMLSLSFAAFVAEVCFAAYLDKSKDKNITMREAVRKRWENTLNLTSHMPLLGETVKSLELDELGEPGSATLGEHAFLQKLKAAARENSAA